MTSWLRSMARAAATTLAILVAVPAVEAAWVSRGLLKGLVSRPPVAADANPTLDTARLEICMRTARNLDRMAVLLDNQLIVIQDTTAHIAYLRHRLDAPQLPRPGRTEKEASLEFERRITKRGELQHLLDRDMKAYRNQLDVYENEVKAFERSCSGSFRKGDLEAVRARLKAE